MTVEEAEEYSVDVFKIYNGKWISISDPLENCQHDFIKPARVNGREIGKPESGKSETFINSKWVDIEETSKFYSLDGLTGNKRLFVTGLADEFDKAQKMGKSKARPILSVLEFDKKSIDRIV